MPDISLDDAVRAARTLIDALGRSVEEAVAALPGVSDELRARVRAVLDAERTITIRDPLMIEDPDRPHEEWLPAVDRAGWYYWPRLRNYLMDRRGRTRPFVQALDDATDRILGALEAPSRRSFDVRGLVVGYVQSGKTANYGALVAKAADVGYRLFIVLSGIHNLLRRQTQIRLDSELVGLSLGNEVGVGRPPADKTWYPVTNARLGGDFTPGSVDAAVLAGDHPVLMVVKKNARVLERLIAWLAGLPRATLDGIPALVIDDEADQASPNTGGDRRPPEAEDEDEEARPEETEPSRINGLIRQLLNNFRRKAYVAYTATPFANVLTDHRAVDVEAQRSLYPKDFIVALNAPPDYCGAERIFGRQDDPAATGELDILRIVPQGDIDALTPPSRDEVPGFALNALPQTLIDAFHDFVLGGACRALRGDGREPATMLIHTTYYRSLHAQLTERAQELIRDVRDEWRYDRARRLEALLRARWDDFRRITESSDPALVADFDQVKDHIGPFLEQLQLRQLNSSTQDDLDFEREPELKAVVVGGNRLSRGLTLEGLLVSYYVRRSKQYDTLMQMARWFGYRERFLDLTRIYTSEELAEWFRHLSFVEGELREEIARYEAEELTPVEMGVKIRRHPALVVTSPLKMRDAEVVHVSFDGEIQQTIMFPFDDVEWLRSNLEACRRFLRRLGRPTEGVDGGQPLWRNVPADAVLQFMHEYQTHDSAPIVKADRLREFIERQAEQGELVRWTVCVAGLRRANAALGTVDLNIEGVRGVNAIERTRLSKWPNTFKAIASADDQAAGLSDEQRTRARQIVSEEEVGIGQAYRMVRPKEEGLLVLYPISKFSGQGGDVPQGRLRLFDDPNQGEHVLGVAWVFPPSDSAATVEYVVGTAGLGPRE